MYLLCLAGTTLYRWLSFKISQILLWKLGTEWFKMKWETLKNQDRHAVLFSLFPQCLLPASWKSTGLETLSISGPTLLYLKTCWPLCPKLVVFHDFFFWNLAFELFFFSLRDSFKGSTTISVSFPGLSVALFIVYISNHTAPWSRLWPTRYICRAAG